MLDFASYFGGDACNDSSQIPQCVDVLCSGIDGGAHYPGAPQLGDSNSCTCASPGQCKVQYPPGARGPNGKLCSDLCHDCICNLTSCDFTSASNQGGGPNMAAETG